MTEQFTVKKFFKGDTQTVAQLFDGGDGGAVVASADDIVDGGLSDAADAAEFIDGNVLLPAELYDALFYRLADIHGPHLSFEKNHS